MPNQYEIGNIIRITATFSSGGTPTDPTNIQLKIKEPDETITTYNYPADITKVSTGVYRKDITPDVAGFWYYHWSGTGAVVAAGEGYFEIKHTEF